MVMTAVILTLAVLVPSLAPSRPVSQQDPSKFLRKFLFDARDKEKEETREADVRRELAEIERVINGVALAFERGDVQILDDYLGSQKIHISLKSRGDEAGYKGRSQVKFMLARLFRERQTRQFLYDRSSIELSSDEGPAFFRATWTYIVLDEDEIVTESLRFKLERTSSGWDVYEILGGGSG